MNNKKTTIVRIPSDIQTYLRIAITNSYMEVYSQFLMSGERSAVVSSFQRDVQKGQSLPLGEIQPVQDVSWQEFQRVDHF